MLPRLLAFKFKLPANDLLRDLAYRRLWLSILISAFGNQVTTLALPLTAAVLLQATPSQMGFLTTVQLIPFALLSLPVGVWLDRVRKLPVYMVGELVVALVLASVPLAWALGWLSMTYLYGVALVIGAAHVSAGSAAQIVLTQVVPRERLVEAHAKNVLASSTAEVAGPGLAGLLIKLVGAPLALLLDALLLFASVWILRGVKVVEELQLREGRNFKQDLLAGIDFVRQHFLLPRLALAVGAWQFFYHAALVVQILFATRELHLSEKQIGLSYTALGIGSLLASTLGSRLSRRFGPGPCLALGVGITGVGWLLLALAPVGLLGEAMFVGMLLCFALGAVLIFINFLSLRQAVTPTPLLGRMTSTMRWVTLLPAMPGALLGGYIGEWLGLRHALAFAGVGALLLAWWIARNPVLRALTALPAVDSGAPLEQRDPLPNA